MTIDEYVSDEVKRPSHYNQGKIDRIETWYLTKPFNEFCASMETHIDKYVSRHRFKGNPLEDIDKAIEYLTRLRQYHEKEQEHD